MIKVTSFYKFFSIPKKSLQGLQKKLDDKGQALKVRGLILIGEEGINSTVSGESQNLEEYKKYFNTLFEQNFFYKNSFCKKWNVKRLSVKIKKEIITIGATYPDLEEKNNHLNPKEWEYKINKEAQVVDVRNNYEVHLGKFNQAEDLEMETFNEFPNKIENLDLDKNKDTLIYCTAGIRCEKALEVMKDKGFKNVYQLEGGILNYLKQYPNSHFKGECFVFDHRVSLDQDLKPSEKYSLCPHCGQPGDISIKCNHCHTGAVICSNCSKKQSYYKTCSKNCSFHFKSGHTFRKGLKTTNSSQG